MPEERTCWLIRAGERSRHARRFVDAGVVAIGWPGVDGLGDLRGLAGSDIHALLEASPKIKSPGQDAAELLNFRDELRVGDVVVSPDAPTGEVIIGEVTGAYEYHDPSPAADYQHVRTVQWWSRMDRALLPIDLADELKWRRTIRRLSHQDEWRAVADRAKDGDGRTPNARGRVGRDTAPRPRHAPAAAPTRRCPGCGYSKATVQFAPGGELCVDCR